VPGKVRKTDVTTGKNYLTEEELQALKLIVEQYLVFAEAQARA
jgi:protein RhuM